MATEYNTPQSYAEEVVRFCFDQQCMEKMSPGLKLIFAQAQPAVFVKIEDRKNRVSSETLDC